MRPNDRTRRALLADFRGFQVGPCGQPIREYTAAALAAETGLRLAEGGTLGEVEFMRFGVWRARRRLASALCAGGLVFQFSGCDIGAITTTTTVDGREALISLVRGAVLSPIDALITQVINDAFNVNDG